MTDASPRSGLPWKPILAIAVVLVVGLAVVVFLFRGGASGDERAALEAALADLKMTRADLFADFTLLSDDELAQHEGGGPLRLHEPRGTLLPSQPSFRWQVPEGASSADVTVTDDEGRLVFAATTDKGSARYPRASPELQPGRYSWKVEQRMPDRTETAAMGFRVIDDETGLRYLAGLAAIRDRLEPEAAALLAAHWAIRLDLFAEAYNHAHAASKRRLAHDTRAWIRRRLGR